MTIAPSPEGFTVDRISRPMNRVSAGSDARVHSYMRSHAIRALPRITHLVIAPATIKHQIIIIYFRFALQVSLAKHIYNIFLLLLAEICSNCLGSYYFFFPFSLSLGLLFRARAPFIAIYRGIVHVSDVSDVSDFVYIRAYRKCDQLRTEK